jgi:hypothetical protein
LDLILWLGKNNLEVIHMKNLTFGQALELLKQGKKVRRAAWGGYWFFKKSVAVDVVHGDSMDSVQTMPLIVAKLKDGGYASAQPYQADILANDWEVVE